MGGKRVLIQSGTRCYTTRVGMELRSVMTDSALTSMQSALRQQRQALLELVDMALDAIRESTDSSVPTLHLQQRLIALAEALGERDVKARHTSISSLGPTH